jgi:hypothetical protein
VNIFLRFFAPAVLLGAVLLVGERPADPPDEIPAAELSATPDAQDPRPAPCPGFVPGSAVASPSSVRLPPAAAARLRPAAASPEARSLSPPSAA